MKRKESQLSSFDGPRRRGKEEVDSQAVTAATKSQVAGQTEGTPTLLRCSSLQMARASIKGRREAMGIPFSSFSGVQSSRQTRREVQARE